MCCRGPGILKKGENKKFFAQWLWVGVWVKMIIFDSKKRPSGKEFGIWAAARGLVCIVTYIQKVQTKLLGGNYH